MGTEGGNTEGFTTPPEERLPPLEQASFIDRFQNVGVRLIDQDIILVGLRPHYGGGGGGGGGVSNSSAATAASFPLRPYAEDCAFYMKTGSCKYGSLCRYNHPIRRAASVVKDRDWIHQEQSAKHLQCKYFLSAGGCKNGSLCKFRHADAYTAGPALNFLGLPKREGEKECPYFMRYGSCSYGANCVFNHPEPLSIGKDISMRPTFTPLDYEPGPLPLSDAAPRQQAAPWLSNPLPPSPLSFQDSTGHHTIADPHWRPEPNPYQAPQFPYPRMPVPVHPSPGSMRSDNPQAHLYGTADEFPQRPGQPECAFFMKTGNCKFKFTCRYHHPKVQYECLLNEKGLPMRPGRNVCQHYRSFGVCKFGRSCLFDHPMNHNPSNVENWLSSKPALAHDEVGSWRK